ncbi:predicted protein [Postia placenta Mad-698-R]|nr:predicted protein [Postia placenta Mad-698-R]
MRRSTREARAHSAAWVSAAGRLPVLAVRLHGAAGATRGPLESPRADDASAGGKRSADWRCSKGDADCLRASGGFLRAGSTQGRAASGARRVTAERRVIDLRVRRGSLPASCSGGSRGVTRQRGTEGSDDSAPSVCYGTLRVGAVERGVAHGWETATIESWAGRSEGAAPTVVAQRRDALRVSSRLPRSRTVLQSSAGRNGGLAVDKQAGGTRETTAGER